MTDPFIFPLFADVQKDRGITPPMCPQGVCVQAGEDMKAGGWVYISGADGKAYRYHGVEKVVDMQRTEIADSEAPTYYEVKDATVDTRPLLECGNCGAVVHNMLTHNKFHADLSVLAKSIVFVGDGVTLLMDIAEGTESSPVLFSEEEAEVFLRRLGQLAKVQRKK